MSDHAYKFTDEDIRRDAENLRAVAERYLERYAGEFPLLVQYKMLLEQGGSLTVPMVRATLNCMRFDAASPIALPSKDATVIPVDFVDRVKRCEIPVRPVAIEVVAKCWNFPYGISTHKTATAVHLISYDSGWRVYAESQRWVPRVRWLCKRWHDMSKRDQEPNIELMDKHEALFLVTCVPGWKWCGSCERLSDNIPGDRRG